MSLPFPPLRFIFFSRLEREKGIDVLLDAMTRVFSSLPTESRKPVFLICGDGSFRNKVISANFGSLKTVDLSSYSDEKVLEAYSQVSSGVLFAGWRSRTFISQALPISDIHVMPSRFLETFGLSALEALAQGIPTLGVAKGGLTPLLLPDFAVEEPRLIRRRQDADNQLQHDQTLAGRYADLIIAILGSWTLEIAYKSKQQSLDRAAEYAEDRFVQRLSALIPPNTKRILLVEDYTREIGGIETYVANLRRILQTLGYEVDLFGWYIPTGRFAQFFRIIGLIASFLNIPAFFLLFRQLRTKKYDLVWCHGGARFLGPLGLFPLRTFRGLRFVTYHDLGYFAPFASRLQQESDVPDRWSLRAYTSLLTRSWKWPFEYGYCVIKFCKMSCIRWIFRGFDHHIVPSEFMTSVVEHVAGISREKIVVFPHTHHT